MSWQITGLLFSSVFELVMLCLVRARLRTLTSGPFCLALLFNAFWSLGYAIELLSPDLESKMLVFQIRCSLLCFYATVWLETVHRMTRERPLLRGWTLAAVLIVPVVTLILLWLPGPGQNPLLRHSFWLDDSGGLSVLRSTLAPWGVVYYLYNYLVWAVVFVLLYPRRRHAGWEYRGRLIFVITAIIGWGADLTHHFGITRPPGFNYVPILFPVTSTLIAFALFRHRLIELAPIARAALIERIEDRIVVLDEDDALADYNQAAAATLGFDRHSHGKPIGQLLRDWPALIELFTRNDSRRIEIPVGRLTLEASLISVPTWSETRPGARVLVLRDITQRKEIETQLRLAKESAEAAGNAQSRFLATMSHEIRTPMNGVVGFTQMLKDTPLDARQREYLDLIDHCSRSLLVIINDVLDYSKIAADQLEIEQVPCNVHELARQSCRLLLPLAEKKGISLTINIAGEVPETVISDPVRIDQILSNLLGNALKFTKTGGVTLNVSAPACDVIAFKVIDTGIGIALEHQSRIFTPFSQADASTTRRFGGTGLGLSITRRLCELMNGTLTFTSRPDEGSTFTAIIRVRTISSSPEQPADPAASPPTANTPFRLLVCEDNPVNQVVIRALLLRLGHDPVFVDNGEKGIEHLARERFDAVLMDIEMPVMDGYEAVRRIRAAEQAAGEHSHTYIIALTAHALKGERERCLAVGMDDFLTKPLTINSLKASLARIPLHGQPRPGTFPST